MLYLIILNAVIASLPACIAPEQTSKPASPQSIYRRGSSNEFGESRYIKFLTYNIRVGAGIENRFTTVRNLISSREKLEKIALAIKSVDPDIVALQEVRGIQQAAFLAKRLNLSYAYSSHGRKDLDWGLALLSKFKIMSVQSKVIYHGQDQRVCAMSSIETKWGPVTCINVHYYLGNYEQQVKATAELLSHAQGPVVLMGDLNFSGLTNALHPIHERLIDTCEAVNTKGSRDAKKKGTVPGLFAYRLDYILVDPEFFEVKDVGLIPEKYRSASDHTAYFAIVKLKH